MMLVNNNISEYNLLSSYSILDYFTYVEDVKVNTAKMDGKGKNSISG